MNGQSLNNKIITQTTPDEYNVVILYRGDFLDIQLISDSCARITIEKREAEDLNISFDTFQSRDPQTKAFLTYVISVLTNVGIISTPNDKISVEVFEQENDDMIIYVSASHSNNISSDTVTQFVLTADCAEQLLDFTKQLRQYYPQKISEANLYSYHDKYALAFNSLLSKNQLCQTLKTDQTQIHSGLKAEKIKEYGTLMCNTPFEKLI